MGNQAGVTSCDGSGLNPNYSTNGYDWAIDVPAADVGTTVMVSLYDPELDPHDQAGDSDYTGNTAGGFATSFHLFQTTGNALDVSTDPSLGMDTLGRCTGATTGYQVYPASLNVPTSWIALCTFVPSQAGIYPLQVKSSGIPGVADSGGGWNQFSIKATSTAATQPHVASLDPMSLYVTTPTPVGGHETLSTRFYLADIGSGSAGQTLALDVFDLGEGSNLGPNTVQILAPDSGPVTTIPTGGTPVSCSISDPSVTIAPPVIYAEPTCTFTTQNQDQFPAPYSDRWIRIEVPIPATYTCTTNCWWQVKEQFGNVSSTYPATDRAVWNVNLSTSTTTSSTTTTTG